MAEVEIYSDRTNAAVIKHPDRNYPGILVQGDTLHALCVRADLACGKVGRGSPAFREANELRNTLWSLLTHYKETLGEHDISLPFADRP